MPRICTVCKSPYRDEVDRALLAGTPHQDIASILTGVGCRVDLDQDAA